MLIRVDKQYLIDCGFQEFNSEGGQRLKKNYPCVFIFDEEGFADIMSLEIILLQESNQWFIELCYTEEEQKDVFDLFFSDRSIKSLIEFNRINSI